LLGGLHGLDGAWLSLGLLSRAHPRPRAALAPASEARRSHTISKWVDYSYKYGLGYQLSDGSVGVLFNDNTKMVLAADLE
jgi:hypothetical protein